ncbi:MAG: GNAT family N-acetyltransferase [Terracidiphilus sp.]
MTRQAPHPLPNLEVLRATAEERPILENLLELYIHDFSEFHSVDLGPDGKFGYPDLPLYWIEPERHPFLARIDGDLAGFALVRKVAPIYGKKAVWDMAEFFVLRGMRRRAIGTHLAQAVWAMFPGAWQVRVMQSNQRAQIFWANAIAKHTGTAVQAGSFEKDGELWSVFSFESTIE